MKLFAILVLVIAISDIRTDLEKINTEQEARAYLDKSGLKGRILELDEMRDSSAAALKLFRGKTGEVIEITSADNSTTYYYKAFTSKESEIDRVQYIFFDNGKISKKEIDSLRSLVMKKIRNGESFSSLAKQFSMDPGTNKRGGDLGWYDRSTMVPGFVSAVRSHGKGDVFLVDLPKEKWYYVVRKTHDPVKRKQIKALYVAVPSK